VHCWGKNDQGQLGHTRSEKTNVPELLAQARIGAQELGQAIAKAEKFIEDERAALTPEKYEQMLLAMAACEIKERNLDPNCPQKQEFDKLRSRNTSLKDLAGLNSGLGQKHIRHESPAVRLWAAGMTGSVFGANPESQKVVLEAAAQEQHPAVLRAMLDAIGSRLGANEGIYELVTRSVEHPEEMVRVEAVSNLTAWGEKKEGALEKVLWVIENDPSPKVRQFACESVGRMEDERALPLLEKLTADPATDKSLYAECMDGLVKMFAGYPKPDEPSEKAYRLVLARLAAEPRTADRPPWGIMSSFRSVVSDNPNDSFHKKWAEKATWFKADELIEALGKVVADRNANWMARTGAVETMQKLGAPKTAFESLLQGYAEASGSDSHVKKKLDEAVK
jgi:hypothetical protein